MESSKKPAIVSFCRTFLNPEMLHVYRQVTNLRRFDNWVVTRKRIHAGRFPWERLVVLRPVPLRFLQRAWSRIRGWSRTPISGYEARQIGQVMDRTGARLIHVYFGTHAARLLPFLESERRAKVVSFHGSDLSKDLTDAELRRLERCTDLFLCRSDSLRQALLDRGCAPERIRLNRTGIPLPSDMRSEGLQPPREEHPLRLLQACRFIGKKGLDATVKATALLSRQGVPVRLTLAGDGPERQSLEQLAREEGIAERVDFPGFLLSGDLEDAMRRHDLFLHPSRETTTGDREGIPNSLLEAMACGLLVVATRHSGIPEAVEDGKEGLLLGEASPDAIATSVQSLLVEPEKYRSLAEAARKRIETEFSIQTCVENLEAAYLDALRRAAAERKL